MRETLIFTRENQLLRLTIIACLALIFFAAIVRADEPGGRLLGKDAAEWAADLKSNSAPQRHLAAWALAQMDDSANQSLLAALQHDDPTVRYWGVRGLSRRGTPAAAEALAPLLADKSKAVCVAVAEAVVRAGQREAGMTVLVTSLADPQEAVRIAAIDSLDRLGRLAAPAAADIEQATADPSEYVKRISARIVTRLTRQAAP